MWKNSRMCRPLRLVCLTALVLGGLVVGGGCQRFDAAQPMGEQIDDQFTEFQYSTDAFLQWCVDEYKGNPDAWGP